MESVSVQNPKPMPNVVLKKYRGFRQSEYGPVLTSCFIFWPEIYEMAQALPVAPNPAIVKPMMNSAFSIAGCEIVQ